MAIEFAVDHKDEVADDAGITQLIGWVTATVETRPGNYRVRDLGGPTPSAIKLLPRKGYLAADGHMYKDETLAAPFRLVANDPAFNLRELTYRFDFDLTTPGGTPVLIPFCRGPAPSMDTTLYLARLMNDLDQPVIEVRTKGYAQDILDITDAALDQLVGNAGNLRTTKLITVGSGGNFATINEALRAASRYAPDYLSTPATWPAIRGRVGVEIRLLSGFVMAEQVFVVQQDLSYVTITSEDAVVTIQRSAITGDNGSSTTAPGINNWRTGCHPAWCAMRNATLPFIKTLFSFDNSGDGYGTVGVMVFEESRAVIFSGCGVKNAGWRGLYVDGATCYARGTIWDGAGYSTGGPDGAAGPDGTRCGIRIANGANVDVRESSAKNCFSGAYITAATAWVISLDASGAGRDTGGTPVVGAEGWGLVCDIAYVMGAGVKANNCTGRGVVVRNGGYCSLDRDTNGNYLSATGCGEYAVRVETGGTLIARSAGLSSMTSHCVSVATSSRAILPGVTATTAAGCGVSASDGSEVVVEGGAITGTGNWGVRLYSSRMHAFGAKIEGTSGDVQLNNGSTLNRNGTTKSDGTTPISCNVVAGEIDPNGTVFGADQRATFRASDSALALSNSTTELVINTAALTTDRNFTLYDSTSFPYKRHTITHGGTGKAIKVYKESGATTLLAILIPGESVRVAPDGSGGWLVLSGGPAASPVDLNRSSLVAGTVYTYTGSSAQTPTLPLAAISKGRPIIIKNLGTSTVTVSRTSPDSIYLDSSSSVTSFVVLPGNSAVLWSDGSEWIATALIAGVRRINTQTGTSYTLPLTDAGGLVTLSNASAVTLTIPQNSTTAFPLGTFIDLAQLGAGQVTVAGSGVTINCTPGAKIAAQYGGARLVKTATDTWLLTGDLSA
ncbi:Triple helix repeat-containing collagen (modular protein) [uncultured Mycobacterium sp.]|uniref:Triple helix repeat-containing collagen (Modular protein) n=1 Tax=uncultured Mycobacterium sp. TaxID=171292 RepID=A0A1Y5P4Y6_9MYCO|nr:Triple helix repeat-containing collagen (modular protein) [uncultured Mycobacterium sp.]